MDANPTTPAPVTAFCLAGQATFRTPEDAAASYGFCRPGPTAPLTAEREAEIREHAAIAAAFIPLAERRTLAPPDFALYAADLLTELDRTRAAMAAELRGLLVQECDDHESAFDEGFYAARHDHNKATRAAAANLGLTL